jgi:protein transport protein SEC23
MNALKRFFVPISECEYALNSILDDLQPDPWQVTNDKTMRPQRAVGTALNIAVSLLEVAGAGGRGSRIVNMMGGPITVGPGKVVAQEYKEKMRSH